MQSLNRTPSSAEEVQVNIVCIPQYRLQKHRSYRHISRPGTSTHRQNHHLRNNCPRRCGQQKSDSFSYVLGSCSVLTSISGIDPVERSLHSTSNQGRNFDIMRSSFHMQVAKANSPHLHGMKAFVLKLLAAVETYNKPLPCFITGKANFDMMRDHGLTARSVS